MQRVLSFVRTSDSNIEDIAVESLALVHEDILALTFDAYVASKFLDWMCILLVITSAIAMSFY